MTKPRLRLFTLLWATCIMVGAMVRGYREIGGFLQTTGFMHLLTHFTVFAVLGLLSMLSFDSPNARVSLIFAGIALGFGTELYEHLKFQSPMEFADVAIDSLGLLAGAATKFVRKRVLNMSE